MVTGQKRRGGIFWKLLSVALPAVLLWQICFLSACGAIKEDKEDTGNAVYYLNEKENGLVRYPVSLKSDVSDIEGEITEILALLEEVPEGEAVKPLLPDNVTIQQCQWEDFAVTLNMNAAYGQLDRAREMLVREGLVKSFSQLADVKGVSILVDGAPLLDSRGQEIGPMTEDSFVENDGSNVNAYIGVDMTLYFTDETGTVLVPEKRHVYYSSSEPLENAVVEELIKGPAEAGYYPTLSGDTQLSSVLSQEDTCYVNFGQAPSNALVNVSEEVQVYSIVDSLAATCHVKNVQFSVHGKSDSMFREKMSMDEVYHMNQDIIQG